MPFVPSSGLAVVVLRTAAVAAITAFSTVLHASAEVRASEVVPIESVAPSADQTARMVSWANGVALRSAISFRGDDERLYNISELVHGYYPGRTATGDLIVFQGDPWSASRAVTIRPASRAKAPAAETKSRCAPKYRGYALRSQSLSSYGVFVGVWTKTNSDAPFKSLVALFPQGCPKKGEAKGEIVLKSQEDWKLVFIQPHLHIGSSLLLISDAKPREFISFAVFDLGHSQLKKFLKPSR